VLIVPQIFPGIHPEDKDAVWLMVESVGKHTVWDAHVLMTETPIAEALMTGGRREDYSLGAVSGTFMSGLRSSPLRPSKDKVSVYYFGINSRGPFIQETLSIRYNDGKWEFQVAIFRYVPHTSRMNPIGTPKWAEIETAKVAKQP
jgi:hypothetical protein